ncbi:MAG TPA: 30S ribosomal protein S4 [Chloroflexota bacterium]|nr:30S ribosomal protein S4 [Chloroflexota bacterium]
MARYTGPLCKLCRREGMKLYLKGDKCMTSKCPVERRPNVLPGQIQGARRRKPTEYGLQLREKQKARRIYGVLERQFRRHFEDATKSVGATGDRLIQILESRLDNVVYRMGFASNRNKARQFVTHGHFTVNGRKLAIPSAMLKVGDVVAVKQNSRALPYFKDLPEDMANRDVASWVEIDPKNLSGKLVRLPGAQEAQPILNEQLIVEHYSRRI